MTTPGPDRNPSIILRAEVAQYIAELRRAETATRRFAVVVRAELTSVRAAYNSATASANAYAAAVARANAAPVRIRAGQPVTRTPLTGVLPPELVGRVGAVPRGGTAEAAAEQRRQAQLAASDARARQAALRKAAAEEARIAREAAKAAARAARETAAAQRAATAAARAAERGVLPLGSAGRVGVVPRGGTAEAAAEQRRQTQSAADDERARRAALRRAATEEARINRERATAHSRAMRAAAAEHAAMSRAAQAHRDVSRAASRMGVVVAGGFLLAAAAAIRWEDQLSKVQMATSASDEETEKLGLQLRALSKTSPMALADIAQVATTAGQLGVPTEGIAKFTSTTMKLATVARGFTADSASESLAKFINITQDGVADVDNLASALVWLELNGASTAASTLEIAKRFAGAAKFMGLASAEILGIGSALSSTGVIVYAAGTSLSRIFYKLDTAVKANGEELRGWAKLAGMTAQDFQAMFKDDPAEAFVRLTEGIKGAGAAGQDLATQFKALHVTSQQDLRTLQNLSQFRDAEGRTLRDIVAKSVEAAQANEALGKAFEVRAETTASQLKIAKNQINDAAITIGTVLLPAIAKAADVVADFAQAWAGLPGPIRDAITVLGTALGVLALVGAGMAAVAAGAARLTRALSVIGLAGGAAGAGAGAAGAARAGALVAALKFARVVGPIAAVAGAMYGVDKAADALGASAPNVDKFTKSLAELGSTGKLTGELARILGDGKGISGVLDDYLDPSRGEKFGSAISKVLGPAGAKLALAKNDFVNAKKDLEAIDKALEGLVNTGNADQAADAFKELGDEVVSNGGSYDDLVAVLPKYVAAAADAAQATKVQKTQFEQAAQALGVYDAAVDDYYQSIFGAGNLTDDLARAFADLREEAERGPVEIGELRGAITGSVSDAMAGARAHSAYDAAIREMREQARGAALDIEDLRSAVGDELDEANAADRANDALEDQLRGIEAAAEDSAGAVDDLASAISAAVSAAFAGEEALDAFQGAVAEIKRRIAEGPGQGVRVDLSLTGNTDMARQAREDVRKLAANSAALAAEDARRGVDPTAAFAARRAELAQTMRVIGFYEADIAATLSKLDGVPDAIARAAADAGESIAGLSRDLEGNTDAARANRAALLDLMDAAGTDISLQITPEMSEGQIAGIVAAAKTELRDRLVGAGFDAGQVDRQLVKLDRVPGAVSAKRRELESENEAYGANEDAIRDLIDTTAEMIAQDTRVGDSKATVAGRVRAYTDQLRRDLAGLGVDLDQFDTTGLSGIPAAFQDAQEGAKGVQKAIGGIDDAMQIAGRQITQYASTEVEDFEKVRAKAEEVADAYRLHATAAKIPEDVIQEGVDYLLGIPGTIEAVWREQNPQLNVDLTKAQADLDALGARLDSLKQARTDLPIGADTTILDASIAELQARYDAMKTTLEANKVKVGFTGTNTGTGVSGSANGPLAWAYNDVNRLREWASANPVILPVEGVITDLKTAVGQNLAANPGNLRQAINKAFALGPQRSGGGWIHGPGGPRDDAIPAMLSNGEYIVNARSAAMNADLLEAINSGRLARFGAGGLVSPYAVGGWAGATRFHQAPIPAPAPVIQVSGGDTAALAAAITKLAGRPIVVQIDGRTIASVLGAEADRRTRTR